MVRISYLAGVSAAKLIWMRYVTSILIIMKKRENKGKEKIG